MRECWLVLLVLGCAPAPVAPDGLGGKEAGGDSNAATAPTEPESSAATSSDPAATPDASATQGASLRAPADVSAPPASAEKTESGLASIVLRAGTGSEKPKPEQRVVLHFTGWTRDGELIDSSVERGRPAKFLVSEVSPGWSEALQLMTVGEKRRFWIPEHLTTVQAGDAGASADYAVWEIELYEIIDVELPPVPKDVSAPPRAAKRTPSGLAYLVVEKGTGKAHPSAASTLVVEYTGWTRDGKVFDSSVPRGEPFRFRLEQVIKGWQEGMSLMVVGERTRFWIPAALAYGEHPRHKGAPAGMLVFEVKLLEIIPDGP